MDRDIMVDFALLFPEILLSLGAIVLLLIGAFLRQRSYMMIMGLTIGLLLAGVAVMLLFDASGFAFNNALRIDNFSKFIKLLILLAALASLIMSVDFFRQEKYYKFEFPILCLFAVIGMMVMVSAANFLTLYLGLELQALSLYSLAAFHRDNVRSSEAGLKYFVLGSLSSGMMLYGISLLFGFTGTINFIQIAEIFSSQQVHIGVVFALVFIFAGIAFKISAVPFHMWTPDVYEGAPTPITAFFAGAPKIAALAVLARLIIQVFEPMPSVGEAMPAWQQIIVFMAMASMALSAFAGIGQRNLKRLLAYSSIGHVGYALVGLAAGNQMGVASLMIYLIIYLVSTIGCFAFVLAMRRRSGITEDIFDLSGLARQHPFMAIMITIQIFSLASIPPLSGFFAKWYSFFAAVDAHLVPLAVFGMLASVVGAFYYLRLIKIMWFDEAKAPFIPLTGELKFLLGFSGAFTVLYMFFGKQILMLADYTAASLF